MARPHSLFCFGFSEHSYLASLLAVATADEQRANNPSKQTSRAAKVRWWMEDHYMWMIRTRRQNE